LIALISSLMMLWLSGSSPVPLHSAAAVGDEQAVVVSDLVLIAQEPCTPSLTSRTPLPCPPCGQSLLGCGAVQPPIGDTAAFETLPIFSGGSIHRHPDVRVNLLVSDIFHPPQVRSLPG
jgi:hypothetical protein